jgi:hypothetical protein
MRRRLLLLAAVATVAAGVSLPVAGAAAPEQVVITIEETFHAPPAVPTVTGDITAMGGVFGAQTMGTLASVDFKPVGFPGVGEKYPFRDHLFVYKALDEYTFAGGTFRIAFEASCNLTSYNPITGDSISSCAGNWRVNGGTGAYDGLKGNGRFTEIQELDYEGAGTGFITLIGAMQLR